MKIRMERQGNIIPDAFTPRRYRILSGRRQGFLSLSSEAARIRLMVHDLLGGRWQFWRMQFGIRECTRSLGNHPAGAGIYFYRLQTENGFVSGDVLAR